MSGPNAVPKVRRRFMTLAPNLDVPARRVLITEALMTGTSVWFLIAMEDVVVGRPSHG